jgi:hypothetical protein
MIGKQQKIKIEVLTIIVQAVLVIEPAKKFFLNAFLGTHHRNDMSTRETMQIEVLSMIVHAILVIEPAKEFFLIDFTGIRHRTGDKLKSCSSNSSIFSRHRT